MTSSDRRLRVGFISQWYDPEKGSAVTPGVQARALAALGHEVKVLTGWPHYPSGSLSPDFRPALYRREQHGDIVVHRVPEYPTHAARALPRMATYLSYATAAAAVAPWVLRDVDVVLVHSTPATAAIPALSLKAIRHIPLVLHIQDLWPETVLASGFAGRSGVHIERALRRFCDFSYRHASSIAVSSPGMADSIRRRGVPASRLTFAPNWADETVFRPCLPDRQLAVQLGLPIDAFLVMYAGNVGHIQGLSAMLDAAVLLRSHKDIHFAIVGSGVACESLESRARNEGLHQVHFVPAQPFARMGEILALGDVQLISFVDSPLFRLTLPSKLQATLAAGRPIIGAVSGDVADVIRDSGAGQVVAPGNGADLARAILELASTPALTEAMEKASRVAYERDYHEATAVRRLSDLLVDAVEEAARQ